MTRFGLQVAIATFLLVAGGTAQAGVVVTGPVKIASLVMADGLQILRLEVSATSINPAGCDIGHVDIYLDEGGRSAEEQRLLANAVYLAFMTNRSVRLYIRDDVCSTRGTSNRLRVAGGIAVLN